MKIVIDTNVVVSAVLRDRIPETVILFVIGNPEFEWVASREAGQVRITLDIANVVR